MHRAARRKICWSHVYGRCRQPNPDNRRVSTDAPAGSTLDPDNQAEEAQLGITDDETQLRPTPRKR
jgi:hypothetical protein